MRAIAAMAFVAICVLIGGEAIAAQQQAMCKFVVEGKTIISGRCNFESDPDGSFRMWDNVHTVYLNVDGKTAEASWNKNPKSFHADSPLGTFTRKGTCWENATAQICARGLRGRR
jgi:hypothetical protein